MSSIASISSATTISLFENPTIILINQYIKGRDAFNANGGETFLNDRRELRSAYCKATVSSQALELWLSRIQNDNVRNEFTNRFQEWDKKIAIGKLVRNNPPLLSETEFFDQLGTYYMNHNGFIQSATFADFMYAKNQLRDALLPELKNNTVDTIVQRYNIRDKELIGRMNDEWVWKA